MKNLPGDVDSSLIETSLTSPSRLLMETVQFHWRPITYKYGEAAGDFFGYSVSMSNDGKTVAIGASRNDASGSDSGQVRVFIYDDIELRWTQLGQDIDGEAEEDESGYSVSLSGDGKTVAIAAPFHNGFTGNVRIWSYNEYKSTWTQLGDNIFGEYGRDFSGLSVSISSDGRTVAIGAPGNDANAFDTGSVRVWKYDESRLKWTLLGNDIYGEAGVEGSGWSVSLSSDGMTVAIAAANDFGVTGHVRVFSYDENTFTWTQLGEFDEEGWSVSLSSDGRTVAIGTPSYGDIVLKKGYASVWAYDENQMKWMQLGEDIFGEEISSGTSVSLSSDGKTVAIGTPEGDANRPVSGHVSVWKFDETKSSWTQIGKDIDGEAIGDRSGHSVSLSSDGKTVAIGAIYNDGNGMNAGQVGIFTYEEAPEPSNAPTTSPEPSHAPTTGPETSRAPTTGPETSRAPTTGPEPSSASAPSSSVLLTMSLAFGTFGFGLIIM